MATQNRLSSSDDLDLLQWAPRVSPERIRRLYELDAQGICDEEHIDRVTWDLYARCESILEVTEAASGRVRCPRCKNMIEREDWDKDAVLTCAACGWSVTWGDYHARYKRKQLTGGGATTSFEQYVNDLPHARTPQAKMLLIDRLIHECHRGYRAPDGTLLCSRPAAVNLIQGRMIAVIELLETLAYGSGSISGALERRDYWQAHVLEACDWRDHVRAEMARREIADPDKDDGR